MCLKSQVGQIQLIMQLEMEIGRQDPKRLRVGKIGIFWFISHSSWLRIMEMKVDSRSQRWNIQADSMISHRNKDVESRLVWILSLPLIVCLIRGKLFYLSGSPLSHCRMRIIMSNYFTKNFFMAYQLWTKNYVRCWGCKLSFVHWMLSY